MIISEDQVWKASACDGKERFSSPALAKKASKRIERRGKTATYRGSMKKIVTPYRCPHCGGWHLGSSPSAQR